MRQLVPQRLVDDDPSMTNQDESAPKRNPRIRPQARPEQAHGIDRQGAIHLVVGPVGAGKSTYAIALANETRALRLTLDDWMARLFRPDRPAGDVMPWYVARAQRCVDQIWEVTREATHRGVDVVLEIGLIRRADRDRFYCRVDAAALDLTVHVIEAARDVRRRRVVARNRLRGETFSMEVPSAIFELASDLYEPCDESELEGRVLRRVRTD